MPRANRHFLPGYVWHLTHRCHKRQFLLKFARDRRRWLYWLFEARRRFGLCVLNYIVTSNHVHLLVRDRGRDEIARAMQLVASRTGQEFNSRKERCGAYWQDRYHATAVDSASYFDRCMTYIDMNMVRAGAVCHPGLWVHSGYCEIQQPRQRYRIIDYDALVAVSEGDKLASIQKWRADAVTDALARRRLEREEWWSQSIAVGGAAFIARVRAELGVRVAHRASEVVDGAGLTVLREPGESYSVPWRLKCVLLAGDYAGPTPQDDM